MTKYKGAYKSMIDNTYIVSESEIAMIYPEYNASWFEDNTDDLKTTLWDMGMDTLNENFVLSAVVQHRNKLRKVVTAGRYIGVERSDNEWLRSGYASQTALDKAKNSCMLDDLYREKALTVDMQAALERKDTYNTEESEDE